MDSTAAFLTLLHEPKGTYLLRENDKGDLRFSVRSQLEHDPDDDERNSVTLVGHIMLRRDEKGQGWYSGSGEAPVKFDTFYDIIKAHQEKDSIYQFRCYFKGNIDN